MSKQRASLRIAELEIANFRTFQEPTVIPFGDPGSGGDDIVTCHGSNGSGKSNAIAAMEQHQDLSGITAILLRLNLRTVRAYLLKEDFSHLRARANHAFGETFGEDRRRLGTGAGQVVRDANVRRSR